MPVGRRSSQWFRLMLNSIVPFHILGRCFIVVLNSICVFQLDLINYFRFCLLRVLFRCSSQINLPRRQVWTCPRSAFTSRIQHNLVSTCICFFFLHWQTIHKECNTKPVMYETKEMKLIRMPSYRQSRRGHTKCDTRISKKYSSQEIYACSVSVFFPFFLLLSPVLFAQRTREVEWNWIVLRIFFSTCKIQGQIFTWRNSISQFLLLFHFCEEKKTKTKTFLTFVSRDGITSMPLLPLRTFRSHYALYVCKSSSAWWKLALNQKWFLWWAVCFRYFFCCCLTISIIYAGLI